MDEDMDAQVRVLDTEKKMAQFEVFKFLIQEQAREPTQLEVVEEKGFGEPETYDLDDEIIDWLLDMRERLMGW